MSETATAAEAGDAIEAHDNAGPLWLKSRARRIALTALVVVAAILVSGVAWVHNYNPLGQSFLQGVNGEFSSHVASANGTEAHYTFSDLPGQPSEQVWSEPSGKFSVEVETEISNNDSHAVSIDQISKPNFGYKVSDYRVSFFRNTNSGSEAGAAFHPFTLAGHTERMVVADYSQWCVTSATAGTISLGMSSLPVTYSFFGFAHTDYVPVMPFGFQTRQAC